MAQDSLSQDTTFIKSFPDNSSTQSTRDALPECISRIQALIEVAMLGRFSDLPQQTIYHYFWAMQDQAMKLSELYSALELELENKESK